MEEIQGLEWDYTNPENIVFCDIKFTGLGSFTYVANKNVFGKYYVMLVIGSYKQMITNRNDNLNEALAIVNDFHMNLINSLSNNNQ